MASHPAQVPPPLQDQPTAKEKKYDRQLRLWGVSGQIALEETHILLINNGPGVVGVETIKNLVLPGLGEFTIHDTATVSEPDLGVNFFLEDSSLGKFRASETTKFLLELNPEVRGNAITEPIETWVARDNVLEPYTLVLIVAPLDPAALAILEKQARDLQKPTFYIHSKGFYSHFSISLPTAFPIVDTHPDPSATTDLRLLTPWPALSGFAKQKTADMQKMNGEEFAHIPYVCLLLHYLSEWRDRHDGKLPSTYAEKSEFRGLVRSGSATEENFDEACAAVLKSLNPPTASSSVREILNAKEAQELTSTSPAFWYMANAVQQFYTTHNELPLPGAVPDMKAQSETYIQLQNIYKTKAREDCAEVVQTIRQLEQQTGRSSELSIHEKEIELFCKSAAHISLVRGRPFKIPRLNDDDTSSVVSFGDRAKALASELTNPESLIGVYLAFLAWDEFVATHISTAPAEAGTQQSLRVPGDIHTEYNADITKLTSIAHKLLDGLLREASTSIEDPAYSKIKFALHQTCHEITRGGAGELHVTSSLTGGLVAQEVIKVITEQYVPADNTVLWDGVKSRAYVLRI